MEQVRQQFHAVHDARAGAGEIGVRIYGVDAIIPHGVQVAPAGLPQQLNRLMGGLVCIEAAGRYDYNFRRPSFDICPRNADGILALASQSVFASSHLNHFRDPMAAAIIWIHPFKTEHTRTAGDGFCLFDDILKARTGSGNPGFCFCRRSDSSAQFAHIAKNVFDFVR